MICILIFHLNIRKICCLTDLTKYNLGIKDDDDDDNNNNNNNNNSSSSSRQREFRSSSNLPPMLPVTPSSTLSTTQRFLLEGGNEKLPKELLKQ